jgi:hypothetical protein
VCAAQAFQKGPAAISKGARAFRKAISKSVEPPTAATYCGLALNSCIVRRRSVALVRIGADAALCKFDDVTGNQLSYRIGVIRG